MSLYEAVGDPLVDDLDHWLKHREVIRFRSAGLSPREISGRMGVPERTVYRWIAEATAAVKAENRSVCQEMFLIHFHRLEQMYEKLQKRIDDMPAHKFDSDVFKCAIAVLDRQSKLLDLDRARGTKGRNDWLDAATSDDLVAEAGRLGLTIPEPFKVPREKQG